MNMELAVAVPLQLLLGKLSGILLSMVGYYQQHETVEKIGEKP